MKDRRRITVVLLFILVPLWIGWSILQKNLCQRLQCVSFVDKQKYALSDMYKDTGDSFQALYRLSGVMLRVGIESGVSRDEAQIKTEGLITQLKGLYDNARSSYPDVVSNEIVCAGEFVPYFSSDVVDGVNINHFSAYMTNRLTYGTCVPDSATHRGTMVIFYCPNSKQLIRLEWIAPKEVHAKVVPSESSLVQSIRCTH